MKAKSDNPALNTVTATSNQSVYMMHHLTRNGYKATYLSGGFVVSDAPERTLENVKRLAVNRGYK